VATVLVLPHIFGEGGRPFYNSVVSTFCHQVATGEKPVIDFDGELKLIHAHRVADCIRECFDENSSGIRRISGQRIKVSEMLAMVNELADKYAADLVPAFRTSLELELFNTYRSYLYPSWYPRELTLHTDSRGWLFEAVRTLHGGQCFMSSTQEGITRGNHFHFRKFERFLVVAGNAKIRIRKLYSGKVDEFSVSGVAPRFVDMPTLHTHSIENTGKGELLTLFWANEIFDCDNPDTYHEKVQPE
jgi:UDP-2-acetamido-2,6-beta-L-arabino-hexul-4-ose reductase